jgi:hypothetical protein
MQGKVIRRSNHILVSFARASLVLIPTCGRRYVEETASGNSEARILSDAERTRITFCVGKNIHIVRMGKNAYLLTKLQLNDVETAVDQATPDYALVMKNSP